MAEMKVTARAPEIGFGVVHNYPHDLAKHDETRAVLKADVPNPYIECRIVLEGKNFDYSGGELTGGTVTKVTYEDFDGNLLAVISDLNVKANGLTPLLGGNGPQFDDPLLAGDDHIRGSSDNDNLIGRGGDDRLFGGKGDDSIDGSSGRNVLTGGKGDDEFQIDSSAKNTITDFDPFGHDTVLVFAQDTSPMITQDGDDTLIDFGSGRLRLIDVDAGSLNDENFILIPATVP